MAPEKKAIQSLRPSGFAPAFGRAERLRRGAFAAAWAEAKGCQPCLFRVVVQRDGFGGEDFKRRVCDEWVGGGAFCCNGAGVVVYCARP
jgi:hypothetical protein